LQIGESIASFDFFAGASYIDEAAAASSVLKDNQ
jgi:hypothetical protein